MPGIRLLERIMQMDAGRGDITRDSVHALLVSIENHLQNILNTHQGSVIQAPDYGIPDLSMLTRSFGGKATRDLEDTLATVITRYEPRLTNVTARYVPASNTMLMASFTLSGAVRYQDEDIHVVFETQIAPDGHIEVRGYS